MANDVTGRGPDPRGISVGITSGAPTITNVSGNFQEEDIGRAITGTGIPASTTILSVQSPTAATMSANATVTNASASANLGAGNPLTYGFAGWAPDSDAESEGWRRGGTGAPTTFDQRKRV